MRGSLRLRLTAWFTGILGVIVLLAGSVAWRVAQEGLLSQTDLYLAAQADRIVAQSASDGVRQAVEAATIPMVMPNGATLAPLYVRVVGAGGDVRGRVDGDALQTLMDAPAVAQRELRFIGPTEERTLRLLQQPLQVNGQRCVLQIAVPWDANADLLERGAILLGTVMLGLLAVAAAGAWLLVGRTLRPIERIASAAEHADVETVLSGPWLNQPESDSEIGHLVATFDHLLVRLRDAFAGERQLLQAQRRFAADASHELRTPLTIMRGEMELALSRPRSNERYVDTLRSAIEELDRMTRIVESLSFLARHDAETVRRDAVELGHLAADVVEEMQPQATAASVTLEIAPKMTGEVFGDADALRRLITNLVDNGIKYTPPGGHVEVTVGPENGHVLLRVTDTGDGIAADEIQRIFERFWRSEKARQRPGSGLGLAICRDVVERHDGHIDVQSHPGEGTTVTAHLPSR